MLLLPIEKFDKSKIHIRFEDLIPKNIKSLINHFYIDSMIF